MIKYDFIEVHTTLGIKMISRTSIAIVERFLNGSKITLNVNNESGIPIVLIVDDNYDDIRKTLTIFFE